MKPPLLPLVVALLLWATLPSLACEAPDTDFMAFFDRFSNEPQFQGQRLTDTIRFGRYRGEEGKERMTWRDYSPERIRKMYGASIVPNVQERKARYLLRLGPAHANHRTVQVVKDESDSYVVTLFFTNREGCWRLYGIQDTSNLVWNDD